MVLEILETDGNLVVYVYNRVYRIYTNLYVVFQTAGPIKNCDEYYGKVHQDVGLSKIAKSFKESKCTLGAPT